ncbi:hypothetical protein ACOSP7_001284 [Xanthoceras sorbifolium]
MQVEENEVSFFHSRMMPHIEVAQSLSLSKLFWPQLSLRFQRSAEYMSKVNMPLQGIWRLFFIQYSVSINFLLEQKLLVLVNMQRTWFFHPRGCARNNRLHATVVSQQSHELKMRLKC